MSTDAAPAPQQTISDANNGHIVGLDPKEPVRTAADWGQVDTEVSRSQAPNVQLVEQQPQQQPQERYFTAEDIEKVRREEKDKLYGKISTMEEQMKSLAQEREDRLKAEETARADAEAARKAQEESEMDVRELLQKKEEEFNSRIEELNSNYERDRALFEREKQMMELDQYRQAAIEQNANDIMPELRDLIHGNNEEEIHQSIEEMKQRTAIILENMSGAQQAQRQAMRGVAPTAPPVGPMENSAEYQSLTPEDIRSMDMETYRKYRDKLIPAASQAYRRGGM